MKYNIKNKSNCLDKKQINVFVLLAKVLFIHCALIAAFSCTREKSQIYYNENIEKITGLVKISGKPFCIVLLDSTYKATDIYKERLSEKYKDITTKAIFNMVDVNIPENKWYREWLYPVSLPVTCIFTMSSDTLNLVDIIPGATHECFDSIAQCVKTGITSELRYINRFSLNKEVVIPALGKIFQCKIQFDNNQDITESIEETVEIVQYPYNLYLKAINAHRQNNDTIAVVTGKRLLTYSTVENIELYSDLYDIIKPIIDPDYDVENEPVLTLDHHFVDLENCEIYVPKAFHLKLTNSGKSPLQIKDIILSCSCVELKSKSNFEINPQDTVILSFEFTADTYGDIEREITIFSTGIIPIEKVRIIANAKQIETNE